MKLDLGCGGNKQPGYVGADILPFDGKVDVVFDLRTTPWPWKDGEVEEVFSSHFVEHLTGQERIGFFNELGRVMKTGAKALLITPNWAHACAYGDPTHQWPPMSSWYPLYLQKAWRDVNAPHVGYTCDFDWMVGGSFDQALDIRNSEYQLFAMQNYINGMRDLHVILTKR